MSLLLIYLALVTYPVRTALVTEQNTFSERIDKLYGKLDTLKHTSSSLPNLYEKLDKLNSLGVNQDLSSDDEELLATIQMWGILSPQETENFLRDLRAAKTDSDADVEYDWNEYELQDIDYAMDEEEEEDEEAAGSNTRTITATIANTPPSDEQASSAAKLLSNVSPSAIIRNPPGYRHTVVSAIDPIAATNERPRIVDPSSLTPPEKGALRQAAVSYLKNVIHSSKCLAPQPRWLEVKQMAPATNLMYFPPCVQLHRCTHDSGCCLNESEMCAPIAGKYVGLPLYIHAADRRNVTVARMLFFNHTRCACVSKSTLQTTQRVDLHSTEKGVKKEIQSRNAMEAISSNKMEELSSKVPTEEPSFENDEESTAPQLRRCTCPTLFRAHHDDNSCVCNCEWPEPYRRRDCLSLSRGREHFGLKDRVCVSRGDCAIPTCDYGLYEISAGRCPTRWYKRIHFNGKRISDRRV